MSDQGGHPGGGTDGRRAGAYIHRRTHPWGRTYGLSVAAGLGFVYGMFIFLGRALCRKISLKINILGKVE